MKSTPGIELHIHEEFLHLMHATLKVKTCAKNSLVVSGKECEYQHTLHTIGLFFGGSLAKSYVLLY
jgi:hypothetical protein